MDLTSVNWTGILIAAIASMGVGALWYSPVLFSRQWMKETGKGNADMKMAGPAYVGTAIFAVLSSFVMAILLSNLQVTTGLDGATVALWLWLGFVAPAFGAEHLFGSRNKNLYLITVGHHLVSMIVIGFILGSMMPS